MTPRDPVPPKRYLGYLGWSLRCRLFGHKWRVAPGSYDPLWGIWGYDCGRCGRQVGW